jgi:hypothetical protein
MDIPVLREQLQEAEHHVGVTAAHLGWILGVLAELVHEGHDTQDVRGSLRATWEELAVLREQRDWLQAELGAALSRSGAPYCGVSPGASSTELVG